METIESLRERLEALEHVAVDKAHFGVTSDRVKTK